MIQFNLLPDVKLAYIKAERQKRLVMTVAVLVSIVAISVLVFLFVIVRIAQQQHMKDLAADTKATIAAIQENKDVDKILTVQSQLNSLDSLHDNKPVASRLYDYITKLTPEDASVSDVTLDFTTNTLEITGKVPTMAIVQKYAETLKYTTYRTKGQSTDSSSKAPAVFANVQLASFNRTKEGAQYTLKMSFDPKIFSNTETTSVTVPAINTTDTDQERPTPLFQPAPTEGQ